MHTLLLTATILLPFGVAAGDELIPRSTSGPVSLSCQFYGVEEDTAYVRKKTHNFSLFYIKATIIKPLASIIIMSSIYMQVSEYGVISFGASHFPYPCHFQLSTSVLIAPFWNYFFHGQVLFRLSNNQTLLNEVGSTINDTLEFDFTPTMLLIATWNRISAYGGNDV